MVLFQHKLKPYSDIQLFRIHNTSGQQNMSEPKMGFCKCAYSKLIWLAHYYFLLIQPNLLLPLLEKSFIWNFVLQLHGLA